MTDYFIGDIQGCFSGLQKALATVAFNASKDTLWLTGDVIARGDDSLSTLTFIEKYSDSIRFVLGNHDLHFLALANGIKKPKKSDNLGPLLASSKCQYYADFIRQQPLVLSLPDESGYMSHAGLPPHWEAKDACFWAKQVEQELQAVSYQQLISNMYNNLPTRFGDAETHDEKLIFTINGLTRMRYCDLNGHLNFSEKSALHQQTSDHLIASTLIPWFEYQPERFESMKWVFGHWAALMGNTNHNNLIGLDTGYVWGNHLTVLNWQNDERIIITA